MTPKIYTTTQAAAILGVDPRTVRRNCADHQIGSKPGIERILTEADLVRLKKVIKGKVGNPNFVAGNRMGQPPKGKRKS